MILAQFQGVPDTTLCDIVGHGLAVRLVVSLGTPISFTDLTYHNDIKLYTSIVESGFKTRHYKPR